MKDMSQNQLMSQDSLVKRMISRLKNNSTMVQNNLLIIVIAFMFFVLSEQIGLSKEKMLLLIPSTITRFERTGFYNDSREWNCSAILEAHLKDGFLYLSSDGSNRSPMLFTAPGEYDNEKKIIISGQKHLVIELDKPIKKRVVFIVQVTMLMPDDLQVFDHTIDCFNKSTIMLPLTPKGKTIHQLTIIIKGEKDSFGIKSIYLE